MQAKITLFTQPNCPRCPAAKRVVEELKCERGVEVEEVDISTDDGLFNAINYNVMSTPTIVVRSRDQFQKLSTNDKQAVVSALESMTM
ncbi:MAG: glutaredoxin family protein [Candidatus Diapherotrites archaeon]|nr:glutaredoxin family protein [Candidatus Diapherotrites archaeon]